MDGAVTVHTSTRIATTPPPDELHWWADSEDGDRHAFPRNEGYPARAIDGTRWTVLMRDQGVRYCPACLDRITGQLRVLTTALAAAAAGVPEVD